MGLYYCFNLDLARVNPSCQAQNHSKGETIIAYLIGRMSICWGVQRNNSKDGKGENGEDNKKN